jgi:hypothetical protein
MCHNTLLTRRLTTFSVFGVSCISSVLLHHLAFSFFDRSSLLLVPPLVEPCLSSCNFVICTNASTSGRLRLGVWLLCRMVVTSQVLVL